MIYIYTKYHIPYIVYYILHTVYYSMLKYSTVQYSTVPYRTVQYSTVQYSTVPCDTVPYSTVYTTTLMPNTAQYYRCLANTGVLTPAGSDRDTDGVRTRVSTRGRSLHRSDC